MRQKPLHLKEIPGHVCIQAEDFYLYTGFNNLQLHTCSHSNTQPNATYELVTETN